MQIYIESIFPESEDVDVCISQAADSVGLKEIPSYEVKIGEQYDWIKKTQVSLPFLILSGVKQFSFSPCYIKYGNGNAYY